MSEQAAALPPHVQIIQMATACWISRLVATAASLNVADHLAGGARSAADLAGPTGTNPRALHRFMRTLASFGILTQGADDTFALTSLGAALKSDAPGSARSTVLAMSGPWMWKALGRLPVLGRDRQDGDGESVRHAALRLPGAECAGRCAVQRGDGRHSRRRAACRCRRLRLLAVRHHRRCRRRHRQHAGARPRPAPSA